MCVDAHIGVYMEAQGHIYIWPCLFCCLGKSCLRKTPRKGFIIYRPGPVWARARLGPGPFGPGPIWAQAHSALGHGPIWAWPHLGPAQMVKYQNFSVVYRNTNLLQQVQNRNGHIYIYIYVYIYIYTRSNCVLKSFQVLCSVWCMPQAFCFPGKMPIPHVIIGFVIPQVWG